VANARQSSGSHRIRIALSDHDDRVILSIRDWGSGFEPAPARPGHFGLENMQHRARLLGGKTMITSAPGQGTLVTTELPLIRAANSRPFDEPEV
jgi:signal transduction histidine kinase